MMYDPLAIDRQRLDQAELRRRAARTPQPTRGPKPPHEAHRRHVLRRLSTSLSSY